MIGIRTQYSFQVAKNAAEAAMVLATDGGELVNIVCAGFVGNGSLAGNEEYAPVPNSWLIAIEAISSNPDFLAAVDAAKAAQAAKQAAVDAYSERKNAAIRSLKEIDKVLQYCKASKDTSKAKAMLDAHIAEFGDIVVYDYVVNAIKQMEFVPAPVAADLKAQVLGFLKTIEKAKYEQVAEALNADEFQVQIKLSALVRDKKATQDKRGFFYAV